MNLVDKLLGNDNIPSKKSDLKPTYYKDKDENGNTFYEFQYTTISENGTSMSKGFRIMKKPVRTGVYFIYYRDHYFHHDYYLLGLDLRRMRVDWDYFNEVSKLIENKVSSFNSYDINQETTYLGNVVVKKNEVSLELNEKSIEYLKPFIDLIIEDRSKKLSMDFMNNIDNIKSKLVESEKKKAELKKEIEKLNEEIERLNIKHEDAKSELFDRFGIEYDGIVKKESNHKKSIDHEPPYMRTRCLRYL